MINSALLNQTILGLYYLVFETRQTINISKANISWLQKLYLDKAISHFGLNKLNIKKDGNSYTLIIGNLEYIIKKSKILDGAKIDNKKCLKIMKEYAKITTKIIKGRYKNEDFICSGSNDITWGSVPRTLRINYPSANNLENNKIKWSKYFSEGNNSAWNKINPVYHFFWRNKLIPAHEIYHALGATPAPDIYKEEWQASAVNLLIFIEYYRDKFEHTSNYSKREEYQLAVIHGILYIFILLKTMRKRASSLGKQNQLSIINKWPKLKHDKSSADEEFIIDAVTGDGEAWVNTYSKHLVALYYALNFFEGKSGKKLLKHIMNNTIWKKEVRNIYIKAARNFNIWKAQKRPSNLAKWITNSPKFMSIKKRKKNHRKKRKTRRKSRKRNRRTRKKYRNI